MLFITLQIHVLGGHVVRVGPTDHVKRLFLYNPDGKSKEEDQNWEDKMVWSEIR